MIIPGSFPPYYWPAGAPQGPDIASYLIFFSSFGFVIAADDSVEVGYDKLALYTQGGLFTHVAKQTGPNTWSSKIGKAEDISHELRSLEGSGAFQYGTATHFLKRTTSFSL